MTKFAGSNKQSAAPLIMLPSKQFPEVARLSRPSQFTQTGDKKFPASCLPDSISSQLQLCPPPELCCWCSVRGMFLERPLIRNVLALNGVIFCTHSNWRVTESSTVPHYTEGSVLHHILEECVALSSTQWQMMTSLTFRQDIRVYLCVDVSSTYTIMCAFLLM